MRTDVQIRQLRSFVCAPFMTVTLLNYEGGKNDDQQNKENQDKSEMTPKSKSANYAHSYSLLSTTDLITLDPLNNADTAQNND
jgi:hypothetical protein